VRDDLHGLAGDEEDTPPGETFLQRLHRRKHEARLRDSGDGTMQREPTALAATEQTPPEPTDADMPPLESLTVDSDYSGFMSAKVSEALRRAALRKLFHSTELNVIDELDDYAEDFTTFTALGDLVTADMRHRLEVEARKQAEALKQAVLDGHESPPEAPASPAEQPPVAQAEAVTRGPEPPPGDPEQTTDDPEQT